MIRDLPSYAFLIVFSLSNNLDANLVSPQNNSQLNYTHVLFEWNQIPGADSYNLYIATDSLFNDVIRSTTVYSLIFIETENIIGNQIIFGDYIQIMIHLFKVTGRIHLLFLLAKNVQMQPRLSMIKIVLARVLQFLVHFTTIIVL